MKIQKKSFLVILLILIIGIGIISASSGYTGTGFSHNIPFSKYSSLSDNDILNKYTDTNCVKEVSGICTKVVDGDTIYVEGVGKIRFVGVNTPERGVEGYQTSKDFVKKLCLNKEVSIDIDDKKRNDRYGRTLGVVIVDNKNLNEMLLKENLAEIMYMPPSEFYPYNWAPTSAVYKNLEKTQTTSYSSSSIMATSSSSSNSYDSGNYVASANSNKFHISSCKWAKKISDSNKITFTSRNDAINQGYQPCKVCCP